ncbi:PTS system, fructose-specific IIABC component, partial [Vibrio cholerae O1 str. EM-1536]
SQKFEAAAA